MRLTSLSPRLLLTFLVATLALPQLVACGSDADPLLPLRPILPAPEKPAHDVISLQNLAGPNAHSIDGIAIHPVTGHMHALLAGQGILEMTRDGEVVDAIAFGERGLTDRAYLDLTILPSGRFVLAAFDESMSYDPEAETLESYFCLVPGWGEIVMENRALGIDPDTQDIFAAPAYYDYGSDDVTTPTDAFIARYHVDGTLVEEHDVASTGIIAEGMAVDTAHNELLVVDGNLLHRLTREGMLLATTPLEGIEDAGGLTLDATAGTIVVADRADLELRTFDLDR